MAEVGGNVRRSQVSETSSKQMKLERKISRAMVTSLLIKL
jgi:hypothetical protein